MKNLVAYKYGSDFVTPEFQTMRMVENLFTNCNSTRHSSIGFVTNPMGEIVSYLPDATVVTLRTQEKKVKISHLKHLVQVGAKRIFEETGRKCSKKEMQGLKDEALLTLLPQTFPEDPVDTQVIFSDSGYVFLDTSYKKAENILSFLREFLGSLPLVLVATDVMTTKLTSWGVSPEDPFTLGNKAVIIDNAGLKNSISGGSLYSSEMSYLVQNGGLVEELGLSFDGHIEAFNLKDTFEIKGIKFEKAYLSAAEGDGEDVGGTFILQYRELVRMFTQLVKHFVVVEEAAE